MHNAHSQLDVNITALRLPQSKTEGVSAMAVSLSNLSSLHCTLVTGMAGCTMHWPSGGIVMKCWLGLRGNVVMMIKIHGQCQCTGCFFLNVLEPC